MRERSNTLGVNVIKRLIALGQARASQRIVQENATFSGLPIDQVDDLPLDNAYATGQLPGLAEQGGPCQRKGHRASGTGPRHT